ncbi:hypothetical protein MPER_11309 [Moniliophthora perniciosa FA553]|nr:hypothetical protein MPER_11309 [Moniliophthora perniciosa FA553]
MRFSPMDRIHIPATVQTLFYGAYIVSFGICMSILLKRRKESYQYYLLAAVILFLLVSANVLVYMIFDISDFCVFDDMSWSNGHNSCWEPTIRTFDAVYETALASSSVADAILLWRCYTDCLFSALVNLIQPYA